VLDHLLERDRPAVKRRLRRAWAEADLGRALDQLRVLGGDFEDSPTPAPPLRCGKGWRNPHPHPPRHRRQPEEDARVDEPPRVDDRVRAALGPQRQALAVGRHLPALDRRRHARGGAGSGASSATPISRSSSPLSNASSISHRPDPDRGDRYRRKRMTLTPGPP
jgi:hypothetical protein